MVNLRENRHHQFEPVVNPIGFDTNKTVVINLGSGDLINGFPRVTAQVYTKDNRHEQFIGSLPPFPDLIELYRNWQSIYQNLCARLQIISRSEFESDDDDELEIEPGGITNVSSISFDRVCQNLEANINTWLNSPEFLHIDRQMRSRLDPSEEIRVIIETLDEWVRRLPWHRWDFFKDYPHSEMALARPEYKRQDPQLVKREKIRILAILGNSLGIDSDQEVGFLKKIPDAEIVFLVNPMRQEFNAQLWDALGWDIVFFAGHSQTERETGRIYINENKTNNSLTIEQLEEGLKAAIAKGLKLAIFNSCDGLGLALALEKLHIPTVIVMREPVPNRVAQDFFVYFMEAFALERLPLYISVQQARRKLQGVEDEFPGASWLPVLCINPAIAPPSWLSLGGIPPCPYRGLFAFREEDADLFFGRENFTAQLVNAVKRKPLVALVGSSGSGKSSVVFAGLVPNLYAVGAGFTDNLSCTQTTKLNPPPADAQSIREQFPITNSQSPIIISFRPENNPIEALASSLAPFWQRAEDENTRRLTELELALALRQDEQALYKIVEKLVQTKNTRLVLIADQFEEVYTQTPESEQKPFLDILLTAVRLAPAFTLVLTLRADFYGHALSYRPLSDALQGSVYNLGPMCREELQSAIEQPAIKMQVKLEPGLTDKLINAALGDPGRLPLLEFALTQLWLKQKYGWLTEQAYLEIGGVEEALANHAEAVYAQLNETDRKRSQQVFIQLVQPGVGIDATRRLATKDEVKPENWDLVTQLASSRLVVTNRNEATEEETVEIVHEALMRSWGRLEQWMLQDGEFRLWQEQLRAALRQWETSNKDEGALLRGKPLSDAEYWQRGRTDELSEAEKSFIQLSLELRDKELKNQKRRRQLTIWGLLGGLFITSILAGLALWQSHNSTKREIKATSVSSQALFASRDELGAMREAIRAGQELKQLGWRDADTEKLVIKALRQLLYKVKEFNRLEGHTDGVHGVAISPDGNIIASAGHDKIVKLWKRDGTLLKNLSGHRGIVHSVAFSPDGNIIATGSQDKTVKLWRKDGTLVKTLNAQDGKILEVAFSPDGETIASASWGKTIKLWKLEDDKRGRLSHKLLKTLPGVDAYTTVSFSPDGKLIAAGGWDGTVQIWQRDGTLLKNLIVDRRDRDNYKGEVLQVSFSSDGQLIATASQDKTVKLWRLKDGGPGKPPYSLVRTLSGHTDVVWGVTFSPDGETIASGAQDRTIKLWKRDGTLLATLTGHSDSLREVTFTPDGQTLVSASYDKTVRFWKLSGTPLKTLSGYIGSVNGVVFSPDGNTIATASYGTLTRLWKRDGSLVRTLWGQFDRVNAVVFSPDNQLIAAAGGNGIVRLWRQDGTFFQDLQVHSFFNIYALAFSPDSQILAIASEDKTVKLWKLEDDGRGRPSHKPPSYKLLKTLSGHGGKVYGVAFSPGGNLLATVSEDKTVKLWKRDGKLLQTISGHGGEVYSVAFNPGGNVLATAGEDKTVKLWNLDGKLLQTISGHGGAVKAVAFSPDGSKIASASNDKTVKLWNTDGKLLKTIDGHSDEVWGIGFSPDGEILASASKDETVMLWNLAQNLDLNQLLTYGCDWASDYLKTNINVSQSDRSLCNGIGSAKLAKIELTQSL